LNYRSGYSSLSERTKDLSRRDFLLMVLSAFALAGLSEPVCAKDGDSGSSGSGSDSDSDSGSNSGSGSENSGSSHDSDDDNDDAENDNSGSGKNKDQDDVRDAVKKGDIISLEKAMKSLREHQRGRIIDASLRTKGRDIVYSFKVKTDDGKIRRIEMNARTGKLR
jgi:hypothetical protein